MFVLMFPASASVPKVPTRSSEGSSAFLDPRRLTLEFWSWMRLEASSGRDASAWPTRS